MSVFEELKRRKIVQWGLAYLAAAWLVVQVVDIVGDKFLWPLALQRGLIVLLGFGFFVALVVAWYHGEKGRQRVSGPELLIVAGVLVTAGAALTLVRDGSDETAASAVAEGERAPGTSEGGNPETPATGAALPASPVSAYSVAVLPLDDHSPAEEHAFFARAMTEEITTALSKVPDLVVKSRNSAAQYPESGLTVRQFARELGVAHVIEGSVQRVDDRARITVQLIDARTDEHLWSETYDRALDDLLEVQVEVARHVADRLATSFTEEERRRILAGSTDDPVAYDLFLRAMDLEHELRTRDRVERQIALLREATERDPAFGQGWGELGRMRATYRSLTVGEEEGWADSVSVALDRAVERTEHPGLRLQYRAWRSWIFGEDVEDLREAATLLREAVEQNPWNLKLIRNLVGVAYQVGDLSTATRWTRRRAMLDPLDPGAWVDLAWRYIGLGLDGRAGDALRRAEALDPREPAVWEARTLMRLYQGRVRDALAAADSVAARDSRLAPFWKGWAHLWAGELDGAHATFETIPEEEIAELGGFWAAAIGHVRIRRGDTARGRRLLERAVALAETRRSGPLAYAGLGAAAVRGDGGAATDALRRYVARGGTQARAIAVDPIFARAREDSAFRAELADLQDRVERMRREVERELADAP